MYILIPNSWFIPLFPSPLVTLSSFSMSMGLLMFCKLVHLYPFLNSTYKWHYMIFISVWLISFSITISRSARIAVNGIHYSAHFMCECYSSVYMHHVFFLHSPVSTHWSMDTGLLPCLGYCKWCCCEHWGAWIVLNYGFLWVYMPGVGLLPYDSCC